MILFHHFQLKWVIYSAAKIYYQNLQRISGIDNQNLTLQTYQKLTYTGLLLNFKSFTSFSYKISLIKCLIDRSFKICNNWNSFHNDIENIKSNLIKKAYSPLLINKVIKKNLDHKFSSNQNQLKDTSNGY